MAVSSFSYFLFGSAQVLWLLFVGRMLAGTTAATVPVAQAYVADITTQKERLRYLGLLGAAAGVAFIMGPAIGGTLSELFWLCCSFISGLSISIFKFDFSLFPLNRTFSIGD